MKEFVIVGSGPASINCAWSIYRSEPRRPIRIVTRDPFVFSKMVVPSVLKTLKNISQFSPSLPPSALVEYGQEIAGIDVDRMIIFSRCREWNYEKLFLGIGSRQKLIPFSGRRIFYPSRVDDMIELRNLIQEGIKRVVIYGFGMVTLELVDILVGLNIVPVIIFSSPYPLSRIVNRDIGDYLASNFSGFIELYANSEISELSDRHIVTTAGVRIPYEALIVAKGSQENEIQGFELGVNEFFETAYPGIFAGGDAVKVFDIVDGVEKYIHLHSVAWECGYYAGLNMPEARLPFRGTLFRAITKTKRFSITIVGNLKEFDDMEVKCKDGEKMFYCMRKGKLSGFFGYGFNVGIKNILREFLRVYC